MKSTNKPTVKILSIFLVVIMVFTAFPTTALAFVDEPLSGVTGSGWGDFGGLPFDVEPGNPPITTEPPNNVDEPDNNDFDSGNGGDNQNTTPIEDERIYYGRQ